jgi:hypothetical protein
MVELNLASQLLEGLISYPPREERLCLESKNLRNIPVFDFVGLDIFHVTIFMNGISIKKSAFDNICPVRDSFLV